MVLQYHEFLQTIYLSFFRSLFFFNLKSKDDAALFLLTNKPQYILIDKNRMS